MKTIYVLLAASFVLAAVPTASAGSCFDAPPREGLTHPSSTDRYIYLAGSGASVDPAKFGEWQETNRQKGLQTERCFEFGILWYKPDLKAALLP